MTPGKLRIWLIIINLYLLCNSSFGITANFTYVKQTNCAPTIVEFTNKSTSGAGITYKWDFGLGAIITTTDTSKKEQLYTKPGQYKIILIATDGVNSDTISTIINIAQGPKAAFTVNPSTGCKPLVANYSSTSIPGDNEIVNTVWDFRNGDFRNGETVEYTYNNTGKYSIVLKVTDKIGCFSFIESDSIINVVNKPTADFTASDTLACNPPMNVSFFNQSQGTGKLTYQWDFGNGETSDEISTSVIYSSNGEYNVRLIATDPYGCSDTIIKHSYISVGVPQASILTYDLNDVPVNTSTLCQGYYRFVCSVKSMPDYLWVIRDNKRVLTYSGPNEISYFVQDTGSFEVELVYGKNTFCTSSIKQVFAKSNIEADFVLDTAFACSVPHNVKLQNKTKDAVKYYWYFNGTKFSEKPDTSYTITAQDAQVNSIYHIYNHEVPKNNFSFVLTAINKDGCVASSSKIMSFAFPLARFMPDKVSGCVPLQVTFSDSSKSTRNIDEYTYEIGSQTITSNNNTPVNFTFTQPGEYNVREIIKSAGCTDTSYAVKISAGEKIIADFSVSPGEICNGGSVQIAASSPNDALIDSWRLSSDDIFNLGFTHKPDTVISIYSNEPGVKDIKLQVGYNGCYSDIVKNAILNIKGPAGNIIEKFSCDSPFVYYFKSGIEPATTIQWTIDAAHYTGTDSVRYKFPAGGNYNITLNVEDDVSNCTLMRNKLLTVRDVKADLTLLDTIYCAGDIVSLNAENSKDYINNCYNEGFLWDYGDGTPPRRTYYTNNSHVYSGKGKYTVHLIAKADNNCTDTVFKNIHVFKPESKFTVDKSSACIPTLDANFTDVSTDTTIVYSVWDFGDGFSDNSQNKHVSHTYNNQSAKTFYSALKVYDMYNCSGAYIIPMNLVGISGNFQATDASVCAGQTVTFIPSDYLLDSVLWDFGDGHISKNTNSNVYDNRGKYDVTLTASKYGCTKTVTRTNYISVEEANADFSVSDTILYCYPESIYYVHKNIDASPVVSRKWILDGTENTNHTDSVMYVYTHPGNYHTQLTVQTLNGCVASTAKDIIIYGPTAIAGFSPNRICYNQTVDFNIESMDDVNDWRWLFGDGSSSGGNPVTHTYTSQGYIVPVLQLINDKCTVNKMLDTLHVAHQTIDYSRVPFADTTINVGDTIAVKIITDEQNILYTWSPDYHISCINCTDATVFPYENVIYTLQISDECINITENFNINVILNYFLDAPTAFTPNNDLNNDIFKFEQKNIKLFNLRIFNRWGKIVFSTYDINECWDGKVNGELQNMDTYTYMVEAETIYGYKFQKKGNFLLIR